MIQIQVLKTELGVTIFKKRGDAVHGYSAIQIKSPSSSRISSVRFRAGLLHSQGRRFESYIRYKYYMAKTGDAIINLPNMVSIEVAAPRGKNGSLGSNPDVVLIGVTCTKAARMICNQSGRVRFPLAPRLL